MALFSAVVVAAGRSERFNQLRKNLDASTNLVDVVQPIKSKVFVSWRGRPIFVHSLERLSSWIDGEIALVIRPEDRGAFVDEIQKLGEIKDKIQLVDGGARRQDSVRNGLRALAPTEYVAIHDAARPAISDQLWDRLRSGVESSGAVVPAIKVTETVKEVGANGRIVKTVDRSKLVRVQTPQVFKYALIREVHDHLESTSAEFTDDAMMCEHLKIPVFSCEGSLVNIKVTTPEDVLLLEHSL